MNNQDTFNIICSFSNPKDLSNFSFLSNIHNKWTNIYLIKNFKKINLEQYVCPKCANFLDYKEDISNYTDFSDYGLPEDLKLERISSIENWFNNKNLNYVERAKVLCDDCEYDEDYSDNIFLNFKYKGSRQYTILYFYGLYSWVALCLNYIYNGINRVSWNEYRKPLSICYKEYIVSEDLNDSYRKYSYFNYIEDENDEEYEDENDEEYEYENDEEY